MPASFLALVCSALIEAQKGRASKNATLSKKFVPEDDLEEEEEDQLDKGRCLPLS